MNFQVSTMIPKFVLDKDNLALCRMPSIKGVKEVVFSITQDSSIGLDGFGSAFFIHFWDMVYFDVFI